MSVVSGLRGLMSTRAKFEPTCEDCKYGGHRIKTEWLDLPGMKTIHDICNKIQKRGITDMTRKRSKTFHVHSFVQSFIHSAPRRRRREDKIQWGGRVS